MTIIINTINSMIDLILIEQNNTSVHFIPD